MGTPVSYSPEAVITLSPAYFIEKETELVQRDSLVASIFRYPSGVCAVRLRNSVGEAILLPYQGQQIWSARFFERELTMCSMIKQPRPTQEFLENFGGFLVHCGITAMGGPSVQDTHPLHGELPNAPFQEAYLFLGENEDGPYLGLGGRYQHTVAFRHNYLAETRLRLSAGSGLMWLELAVTNLKHTPMEWMYLAHINFRPVDNGRLVYSALPTPQHVRVSSHIPAHIQPPSGYRQFLEELSRQPEKHHVFLPTMRYDPEVVISIDYLTDKQGWAHTLQVHPDGSADYVRHRPDQLDKCLRWISRTPDQDALGIEPATAEVSGYLAEKAKGNVKILPPGGKCTAQIQMGALLPEEAQKIEQVILRIIAEQGGGE